MMANNEEEIFYSDDDLSDSELYQVCSQLFMTGTGMFVLDTKNC